MQQMSCHLGSHDSFTYWVDVHAPVGPDQKLFVKYLATMFSVLAKKVMVKWSMTQVITLDLSKSRQYKMDFFQIFNIVNICRHFLQPVAIQYLLSFIEFDI